MYDQPVGSRLALDQHGRRIVVVTTPTLWLHVGERFLVVHLAETGWFEPRGRRPTAREQAEARPPYESKPWKPPKRWHQPADEELDEREALEACRLEQQHQPTDLLHAYAA